MEVTAIKTKDKLIQIFTQPHNEGGTMIVVRECDETFIPNGRESKTWDKREERVYHKELRVEASKVNQLITNYSTSKELNPEGYIKNFKSKKDDKNTKNETTKAEA